MSMSKLLPTDHPWADRIHIFDCIPSTNTLAKEYAAKGAPHGTALIARQQTGGRGRLGRSFSSPAGQGVYLSVILRPACKPEQLLHLTCSVGVAAADAVEAVTHMRPGLKWINDLVCGKQKLGGILCELSISPKTGLVDYAIVGIGLNCLQKPEDFPPELKDIATSLLQQTGKAYPPETLGTALLIHLEKLARYLPKTGYMDRYKADCVTIGQQIVVLRGDEKRYGTALDVDRNGSLLIRFTDGSTDYVASGEVSIRGMYGYC